MNEVKNEQMLRIWIHLAGWSVVKVTFLSLSFPNSISQLQMWMYRTSQFCTYCHHRSGNGIYLY